jgi:hypothetical protein
MTFIRDPDGSAMRVTANGRGMVDAVSTSFIGDRSQLFGNAYSIYSKLQIQVSATNEYVLFMRNDSDENLHVSNILFSTDGADVKIEAHLGGAYVSGGTTRVPLNLNRGSGNVADLYVLDGAANDLACTVPAASAGEIMDVRIGDGFRTYRYDWSDALIITKGRTFLILCEGTAGDKVRATAQAFFRKRTT